MPHKISRFGWLPDLPDHRDLVYSAPKPIKAKLPKKVDLRKSCPGIYDQGELGSCTANAISAAFEFNLMKQKAKSIFTPSRLFIYYNERVMEQTISEDSGAMIRDGIKSINKKGVCPEKMWPYIISKFTKKPDAKCYTEALKHQSLLYQRVTRKLEQMQSCLAEGYPFVFGFTVYDAFESSAVAKSGKLDLPKPSEGECGGHAVLAVGYDDTTKRFIVRNSWGNKWGQKGYFTMPYDYLLNENLADDFWSVRLVENE
ncbi:MAG TPA: C1 family peptidase [Bacteroidales bacterium]|nr:C1 family peptidase [Bacteroidales bacterium]HPS16740.1 C1 family peptidase [Bacteroidales bacterium]